VFTSASTVYANIQGLSRNLPDTYWFSQSPEGVTKSPRYKGELQCIFDTYCAQFLALFGKMLEYLMHFCGWIGQALIIMITFLRVENLGKIGDLQDFKFFRLCLCICMCVTKMKHFVTRNINQLSVILL